MEGRKIGYRTYRSLRERHKGGHSAGGRIYGYSSVQDGEYRKRVIDADQAEVVKEIFERYVNGESAKTIARCLNERGIPSPGSFYKKPRSKGWPHTTILGSATKGGGILRNPIYKGTVTWNKRAGKKRPGTGKRVQKLRPESEWVQYQDSDLRIVSDELWHKAQQRLKAATTRANGAIVRGRPPRYLLTGLLKCESCGSSYVVRNGRSYCCSSQANGRDTFCDQPGYIKREIVEDKLLGGIKEQLLDPKVTKAMAKEIRKQARAPKRDYKAELSKIDRQIDNVVESLVSVGKSEALTGRLRELESKRAELEISAAAKPVPIQAGAADKWAEVVGDLENLRNRATAGEIETARGLLREIIGEVSITEKPDGIFAYTRLNATGYKAGAEKRT